MAYRVRTYYHCPECGKKGVTLQLKPAGEDGYGCRYCSWWVFTRGSEDEEGRARLAEKNPGLDP